MKIYTSLDFKIEEETFLTVGKFDGLHLGHQELIRRVVNCKKPAQKALVFRLKSEYEQRCSVLLTDEEMQKMLEEMGVDILVDIRINRAFLSVPAEAFIKDILLDRCHMKGIVCGSDFFFGKEKQGDTALLKRAGEDMDFSVTVLEKKDLHHHEISSTAIREMITLGKMEEAEGALGYPYFLEGPVIHGRHLATEMGFPTANVRPDEEKILPPFGVYAAEIQLGERTFKGMANLGIKPTVTEEHVTLLETYVFDLAEDLYGKELKVRLIRFMRPEKKFPSITELKNQLSADKENVFGWFQREEKDF